MPRRKRVPIEPDRVFVTWYLSAEEANSFVYFVRPFLGDRVICVNGRAYREVVADNPVFALRLVVLAKRGFGPFRPLGKRVSILVEQDGKLYKFSPPLAKGKRWRMTPVEADDETNVIPLSAGNR